MTLSGEVIALIAGLVALSQGLVQVIKMLVNKVKSGGTLDERESLQNLPKLSIEEHDWLKKTHDVISRCDDEGSYLVYVPRTLTATQKDITDMLSKIHTCQEKTIFVLERFVDKIKPNG